MLPIDVLKKLREELVFYKKKELTKVAVATWNRCGGRFYSPKFVKSGLPMSGKYGWFTYTFMKYYAPEKITIANLDWCIERSESCPDKEGVFRKLAKQFGTYKVQKQRIIKGKQVQYKIDVLNQYKPEDAIDVLAKNPNLVNHVFPEVRDFVHKKLPTVKNFHSHDCALAIILARLDAVDFDMMAIPTQKTWFEDKEFGFGSLEWKNIINVLVAHNYFCKTHGDGTRKGLGIITCEGEPVTFDEANYIPSLLIPDVNIAKVFNKHKSNLEKMAEQRAKKEMKKLKKTTKCMRVLGEDRKFPVPFVREGLSPKIQKFVDAHPDKHGVMCMRTLEEFLDNCQLLGFRFDGDVLEDTNYNELRRLYENITNIALRTNYKYATVIHVVTKHFKEWCKNINYRPGAFRDAIQYIMFGQTKDSYINHQMNIGDMFKSIYEKCKKAIFTAKV